MSTDHMTRVHRTLADIPKEKLSAKLWRTGWGVAIVAFAFVGKAKLPGVHDYVWFATACFGAVMVSGELFAHPFKLFVAMLRDVLNAWRGTS